MQPIGQNILVKPYPPSEVTQGGLIVPDSVKKPSNKVYIVAVGNGSQKRPMKLKAGQTGFRVRDWGLPIVHEGELHYFMEQNAILSLE